jgi:hypothetical protein
VSKIQWTGRTQNRCRLLKMQPDSEWNLYDVRNNLCKGFAAGNASNREKFVRGI